MAPETSMERLACPQCGSEWFVSSRIRERIVFQMDAHHHPILVQPELLPKEAVPINPDHIYCGACTWQGPAAHLVESRM
jgi:hypothetical protein